MPGLPTGTVTFLFTDIEGSTRLWQEQPAAMPEALQRHNRLPGEAIELNHGVVFHTPGDAFCAAFATTGDAVAAATEAQQVLAESWNRAWEEGAQPESKAALSLLAPWLACPVG